MEAEDIMGGELLPLQSTSSTTVCRTLVTSVQTLCSVYEQSFQGLSDFCCVEAVPHANCERSATALSFSR